MQRQKANNNPHTIPVALAVAALIIGLGAYVILIEVSRISPMLSYFSPPGPTLPQGILYYVPITITNTQPIPINAPFQDQVVVNSANYSTYESGNLQNVEFFYANGTIVPSWLESNATSSSTASVYWLKTISISAGGSITVYMGFASTSTNLLNSVSTGEAPELSSTYGQYDDGNTVFTFYDNFAGSSLKSQWNIIEGQGTPGSLNGITVNSGLTLIGSIGGIYYGNTWIGSNVPGAQLTHNTVLEMLANVIAQTGSTTGVSYGYTDTFAILYPHNGIIVGQSNYAGISVFVNNTQYSQTGGSFSTEFNKSLIWSIQANSIGSLGKIQGALSAAINHAPQFSSKLNVGIFSSISSGGNDRITWIRARAYPPQGVMPITSFGYLCSTTQCFTPPPPKPAAIPTVTYGVGLSGAPVIADLTTISGWEGSPPSAANLENYINHYLVPLGIKYVYVDVGWGGSANTSNTLVAGGYNSDLALWLNVSQQYNIKTIFSFIQFGYLNNGWSVDLLNQYPQAQTVNALGNTIPFCLHCDTNVSAWTIASPYVYRQMEEDLKQMYVWYGKYTGWIGFGEGAGGDRNNYVNPGNAFKAVRPYDNFTISSYAHSVFFQSLINTTTGNYLTDNSPSKIYNMFLKDKPDIALMSASPLVFPQSLQVYGGEYTGHVVLERFYIPFNATLNGFRLRAYLNTVGNPGSTLYAILFRDTNSVAQGEPEISSPVETAAVNSLTSTPQWTTINFNSTIEGGDYYWVGFATASGDSSDYYNITVLTNLVDGNAYTLSSARGIASTTAEPFAPILAVQAPNGRNVTVYPYIQSRVDAGPPFNLEVQRPTKINTIAFFLQDRAYDAYNETLTIVAPNHTVLAGGAQFSLLKQHGIDSDSWVPFQFNKTVMLYPGNVYTINASTLPVTDHYSGSSGVGIPQLVFELADKPQESGYLNQSMYPIIQIGLMDLMPNGISNYNYLEGGDDLGDSPNSATNSELAMRFMATQNETLKNFEVNIQAASGSGSLGISLRADNESIWSHPMPLKVQAALAKGSASLSSINSMLTACPSNSGVCTWANVTFAGNTMLTANTYYWIVMNITGSGAVTMERLSDEYQSLTYTSTNDFYNSWGVPSDGPTELGFKVVTTGKNFTSTIIGGAYMTLGPNSYLAQAFESNQTFQLKGVWLPVVDGTGLANISIETDNGFNAPSGNVLSFGNIYPNETGGVSMEYASLLKPITIAANVKYWIVANATCTYYCSTGPRAYYAVYRSDDAANLYHNGTLQAEYKSSASAPWAALNNNINQMAFILAGSNSVITFYNTSTLSTEIKNYDLYGVSSPLVGYNNFLDYMQANLMYNLSRFMTAYAKRTMYWYTGLPYTVAISPNNYAPNTTFFSGPGEGGPFSCRPSNQTCGGYTPFWWGDELDHVNNIFQSQSQGTTMVGTSLGNPSDNGGTLAPVDLRTEFLLEVPTTARNPIVFSDWSEGNTSTGIENISYVKYWLQFGNMLNRMDYNGGYYGTDKNAVKALLIGESGIFPEFLSPAINITEVSDQDGNQTAYGNFSRFNVIIGLPQNPTNSFMQRLTNFVNNGGGVVYTSLSTGNYPLLGLQQTSNSFPTTSNLIIEVPNKITAPYASISYAPYWEGAQIVPLNGYHPSVLVEESNGNPVIVTNNYGSGKGVLIEQPWDSAAQSGNAPNYNGIQLGSPRDSYFSLLINAIFYAANRSSMTPILWENSYLGQQNWSPQLQFSIDGSPGKPVLLWLSNNDSYASPFSINLNGTFFNISKSWKAMDISNMSVISRGTGSSIGISLSVPAYSWQPIYILNSTSNAEPLYSTAQVNSTSISGNSITYTLTGAHNSSNWLIVQSNYSITSVSSNLTGALQKYSSIQQLNSTKIGFYCNANASGPCTNWSSYSQEGWYYDSNDNMLYVHYRSGSPIKINVLQTFVPSTTTTPPSTTTTPTTITQSSGSSGGGGGGGSFAPTIINTSNSITIYNFTQDWTSKLHLEGVELNVTENFIGLTIAGITVNNKNNTMTQNQTVHLFNQSGYSFYMHLINISQTKPTVQIHSVIVEIYANSTRTNTTSMSSSSTISASSTVASSTIQTTTYASNSSGSQGAPKGNRYAFSPSYLPILAGLIVIAAIAAVAYALRRQRKPPQASPVIVQRPDGSTTPEPTQNAPDDANKQPDSPTGPTLPS